MRNWKNSDWYGFVAFLLWCLGIFLIFIVETDREYIGMVAIFGCSFYYDMKCDLAKLLEKQEETEGA